MIAELAAINRALKESTQINDNRHIWIHTDSLSAIQAIKNYPPNDNVKMITSIYNYAKTLNNENRDINISWLPSHTGIAYNEQVDQIANEALYKEYYEETEKSISSIKQKIKVTLNEHHQTKFFSEIQNNPKLKQYSEINPELKRTKFTEKCSRLTETTISKLRVNNRTKCPKRETNKCKYCDMPFDNVHYLIVCPKAKQNMQLLMETLSDEEISLSDQEKAIILLSRLHKYPNIMEEIFKKYPPNYYCSHNHNENYYKYIKQI